MRTTVVFARLTLLTTVAATLLLTGCSLFFVDNSVGGGVFGREPFSAQLVDGRTFYGGTAVTTATYLDNGDGHGRRAFGIDFNGDGKIDPVVGYGDDQAVIQILLSTGAAGVVDFESLTLDSKRDMQELSDVAVGDIDGDGLLDIVAGAEESIWYFRQPSQGPRYLRGWGNPDGTDTLRERIDVSTAALDSDSIQAVIDQAVPVTVNLENYLISVESRFPDVEIGDFNNDGWQDICASRLFHIHMEPRPDVPVEPIDIYDGDVIVYVNPGGAIDGRGWAAVSAGTHERQQRLDRDGASSLMAYDLDSDGDLDIVSAARNDNNVQIAWFENPLPPNSTDLNSDTAWTQWRIGSLRDVTAIDIGDINADGRVDVVAAGSEQMQVRVFVQPASTPKREYDWDHGTAVTFENYNPFDAQIIDIDDDGVWEIVVAASGGALRYLEPGPDVLKPWTPMMVATLDPVGEVGLLGYGDIDGDTDIDLIAVVKGQDANQSHLDWVRNNLR